MSPPVRTVTTDPRTVPDRSWPVPPGPARGAGATATGTESARRRGGSTRTAQSRRRSVELPPLDARDEGVPLGRGEHQHGPVGVTRVPQGDLVPHEAHLHAGVELAAAALAPPMLALRQMTHSPSPKSLDSVPGARHRRSGED